MSEAAILTLVSGLVSITTMIVGFLTLWVRLKYGERKLDANTAITIQGTDNAASNARIAAETAADAKISADKLAEQLNGSMDARITKIVKEHTDPLIKAFREHNDQDQQNMDRIEMALKSIDAKIGNK